MLLDEGMDTGPILAQAQIPVDLRDNTGSLTEKLSQVAARLLQEALVRWMRQEVKPRPQDEAEATYCNQITREEGEIDWRLPAREIWRRVRAFNPWPGSYSRWGGKQIKILEALPLAVEKELSAGQVTTLSGDNAPFGIGTGEGILGILKVQLEGKRAMSAADFLRGQRDFNGSVLPS
jgi:methionyl-tRNA formyltransferase